VTTKIRESKREKYKESTEKILEIVAKREEQAEREAEANYLLYC
jgi:hypothetical protein